MKIVFDKDLSTKREVNINFFGENISRTTLNATMIKTLSATDTDVPNLESIKNGFTSVAIVDGDITVPIQNSYNKMVDASAAYNSQTKEYSVTIILGYEEPSVMSPLS